MIIYNNSPVLNIVQIMLNSFKILNKIILFYFLELYSSAFFFYSFNYSKIADTATRLMGKDDFKLMKEPVLKK